MVSFQLESDAEVRSPRFTCGIKVARAMDRADSLLVSSLFKNHFVVELLWPRRERRARMIAVVMSNIFNLCLKSFKIRIRFRDKIESDIELNVLSRWLSTSRT